MEARGRVVHWDLAMCGREESAKVKLFFFFVFTLHVFFFFKEITRSVDYNCTGNVCV